MKKFFAVMLALMMAAIGSITVAEQGKRKMETAADADEFITVFLGDHPEDMEGVWAFTAQMEAALVQTGGIAGMAKQLAALGSTVSVMPAYEGEISGMKAFFVPCTFSAMQVDLILVIQDGAVAGLITGAYSGSTAEAETDAELYDSIELALPVPTLGELPGILTVPKGEGPYPVVVLLQGSGPSDMDETIGNLKPFRDLAEGLAERGVAVYRFDKRSYVYGMEMSANRQITLLDETVEDAVNAVQLMAQQDGIDPERIYVLGHSLGGNAVPAAAGELEKTRVKARGFIMMAASLRPLDVLMREQYDFLYSLLPEITEEQQAEKDAIFRELDKLQALDSLGEDDMVAGAYSAYWKWLAEYDILKAAEEITKPVLLLQGEEDYQVTMKDFEIWKEAVGRKENWQLISYPGLVHTFTAGKKAEGSAVYARTEKVDKKVIEDIADFVTRSGSDISQSR